MELPGFVVVKEQALAARLAAAWLGTNKVAMVWGRQILLWECPKEDFLANPQWVRHELKHVEQYQRLGFVPFLLRYVFYSIQYGYHNNPLEVEARKAEDIPHPDFG